MALQKEYSYQLYNSRLKETSSWRSNHFVIFYGENAQHYGHYKFPSYVKSKDAKQEFIGLAINTFKFRRIKRREIPY